MTSFYSVHHVTPRALVSLGRFLSWLPNVRPVLARRVILNGALDRACLDDLRPAEGISGERYLVVGSAAAEAITQAYKAAKLPLKEGAKIAKTMRAEVYARSPLRPPENGPQQPHHQGDAL
jgi:hypothetical protein